MYAGMRPVGVVGISPDANTYAGQPGAQSQRNPSLLDMGVGRLL